ncbi:MAG: hypothetical protein KIT84_44210 [Labilithrix sp.]|nr:hypothetical protein [Labilithrix sp.]MCW5818084.1 hypothetical protein [Labilithrix sp.]
MRALLAAAGDPDALGKHVTTEGTIDLGRRVRVGYLDQERASLDPNLSNLRAVARAVPSLDKERVDPRSYVERFMFDSHAQRKKVGALSGCEHAPRACRAPRLRREIGPRRAPRTPRHRHALGARGVPLTDEGLLLVLTHDRYLLDRVTTGILSFEGFG